jgi:surface polysaccharide O-acyltransferase-like enzyme
MATGRNQSIDLVKIIAMLGVMTLHTALIFDSETNPISLLLFSFSGISMPLFFMVSGYLMIGREVTYEYIIRKILKICRFVFLITFIYELFGSLGDGFSLIHLLKSFVLSFLQMGGVVVFWYFGAMIILYLLLPLINRLYKNMRLGFAITFAFFLIISTIHSLNLTIDFEQHIPQTLRVWNWIFYFTLGGLIRSLFHEFKAQISDGSCKHYLSGTMLLSVGGVNH